MTKHSELTMHREKVRISDPELIRAILDRGNTAVLSFHDEPYPYIVPMNYGYEWKEHLTFYFHMAIEGYRIQLIHNNPKVALNANEFLDRQGYQLYRKENHDYRSVSAFGTAYIISPEQEEEYIHGMSVLCVHNNRKEIKRITTEMRTRLLVLKVVVDEVTAKSQYPVTSLEEIPIPPNVERPKK